MNSPRLSFPECLSLIPPVWELDRYVAVNPFVGWTQDSFATSMETLEAFWGGALVPDETDHPELASQDWHPDEPVSLLGPFLASYYTPGTALVPPPWKDLPLWQAWKESLPGSLGLGLRRSGKLRALLRQLPPEPLAVLTTLVPVQEGLPRASEVMALLKLAPGWASYLRRRSWPQAPQLDSELVVLAAMLAVVTKICPLTSRESWRASQLTPLSLRLDRLGQKERLVRQRLQEQVKLAGKNPQERPQAQLRAAFCIDVRSEVFRRHWEASDPDIATDGFAGFFGVPASWEGEEGAEDLLPVLLSPSFHLKKARRKPRKGKLAVSGTPNFPLVEVTGWSALYSFVHPRQPQALSLTKYAGLEEAITALPEEQKGKLAASILKNLGWLDRWTPLMVLVGHASSSVNNPHAASLDCGACGGKSGEASARMAAALLNDPATRSTLAQAGVVIPGSTRFAAAVHNTTLDTLEWVGGPAEAMQTYWLPRVRGILKAGELTRAEKEARFSFLKGSAKVRSGDEAQTRPENALAGNTALLAVPASWTRSLNLEGRTFLHSYDAERDDGSILELILTAPVVVATWINLQYFASTSSPRFYGAGNKLLHTRLGDLGVLEGLGGDLKVGLPEQSVVWEGQPYHEPLRLSVLVVATRERVESILKRHHSVAELFEGGWAHLSVLDGGEWFSWEEHGWGQS